MLEFNQERILQEDFFSKANLPQDDDDAILAGLTATVEDGSAGISKKQAKLAELQKLAADYNELWLDELSRLAKLLQRYTEGFMLDGDDAAREKYFEVRGLKSHCNLRIGFVQNLQAEILRLLEENEKVLDIALRKEFGKRLRKARQACGLTQLNVATQLHSLPARYAYYEQARTEPSIATLIRICKILNADANELLGLSQ